MIMETPGKNKRSAAVSNRKKSLFQPAMSVRRSPHHDSDSDLGIISLSASSSDEEETPKTVRSVMLHREIRTKVTRQLFSEKYSNKDKYEFIHVISDSEDETTMKTPTKVTPPILTPSKHEPEHEGKENTPTRRRMSLSGKISTKSFYGASLNPRETSHPSSVLNELNRNPAFRMRPQAATHRSRVRVKQLKINRGVSHKIRKTKYKKKTIIKRSQLLRTAFNIMKNSANNNNNSDLSCTSREQIDRVMEILRNTKYVKGRPLQVNMTDDEGFSSEDENFAEQPSSHEEERTEDTNPRKFFKSKLKTKAKVQLANNISVTMKQGKMVLDKPKSRKRRHHQLYEDVDDTEFKSINSEVEGLLKAIDDPETTKQPASLMTKSISNLASDLAAWNPVSAESPQEPLPQESPKLFPVFYRGQTKEPENLPPPKRQKSNLLGFGEDQLQIDAGQREYGAIECRICGFVYTQHVPEDELLHRNFHQSSKYLQFKGWEQENIVHHVPEWGIRGRIIAIMAIDAKNKLTKATDVLHHIDIELGFPQVNQHPRAITYFACNGTEIMGVCVAQPLREAYRLLCELGIDFCSKEAYPVRCGISRIWVNAKYRRQGVASKLFAAVRGHFIFGYILHPSEIAFSAPTEMGKQFAEKVCQRADFYVFE